MAYPYRIWHPFTQMARFDAEPKLVVERAEGNRLIDHDGREYIDAVASLWSVLHGHGHPQIVGAIQAQAAKLQHSTLLGISHRTAIEFADSLVRHLPEGLSRVYYSSDGSSAVEVALKMAIQYWVNAGHPFGPPTNRCCSSRCGFRTGIPIAARGAHQISSATLRASTCCVSSSRTGRAKSLR